MNTQNVLKSLGEYSKKDQANLKKKTTTFVSKLLAKHNLKSLKYADRYAKAVIAEVPIDLILIPDYQVERHDNNENHVNEIYSQYNEHKMEYVTINYRSTGIDNGYLYIADGQHRTEVQAKRGKKTVMAFVLGYSRDNEILEFSEQDQGKKNVAHWQKYEARLLLDPKSGAGKHPLAQADRIIRDTFIKLKVDPRQEGLAIQSLEGILTAGRKKLVEDAETRCMWICDILVNSRFYKTGGKKGLSADTLNAMQRIYLCVGRGLFGDAGYDTVARLAKKALFETTPSIMLSKINNYLFDGINAPIWGGMHRHINAMSGYVAWQIYESLDMDFLEAKDKFIK